MARHILDKSEHAGSESRAEKFSRIERDNAPRPQSKVLQQRAKDRDDSARTKAFLKIDREQ